MDVEWAGTSLESGRFSIPRQSSESELLTYFGELQNRGEGYVEVRMPGLDSPWLALSFRGDHAVVHSLSDEGSMALLVGDSSVEMDETVEVPVMDEPALFSGEFVSNLDRAWEIIRAFVHSGEFESLGEWSDL